MAATAWLMSFSSCIVCGFDSYTVLFKRPQRIFPWGHLKSTVYESNPHTIQELKDNISHAVAAITVTMLHPVYLNMIRRAQLYWCSRQPLATSSVMVYPFSILLLYQFLYLRYATDPGYFFVTHSVLWDHRHICNPSLTGTSICGAYLYCASRSNHPQCLHEAHSPQALLHFSASCITEYSLPCL